MIRRLTLAAFSLGHLIHRPLTLGVRGAAFDGRGRVFLVRHTYLAGWFLPGGGVSAGETLETALARELSEEGNIEWDGSARLVSMHLNRTGLGRDHVALYRIEEARQTRPKVPDREIAASGFFAPDALPADTTEATRRRLHELIRGEPADPLW